MVEKLLARAWRRILPSGRRAGIWMNRIEPRVWVLLIVAVLAGVRVGSEFLPRIFSHRNEIAKAIGSAGHVFGYPQVDSSGSKMIYLKNAEQGFNIILQDIASGKNRVLRELPKVDFIDSHNQISPFSPDNNLFAYALVTTWGGKYLGICDVNTGEEIARLETRQNVNDMVWLTPTRLIWLGREGWGRSGEGFRLHLVEKQTGGKWEQRDFAPILNDAGSLMAISANVLGWIDEDGLKLLNVTNNETAAFIFNEKRIVAGDFAKKTGWLLATCKEEANYSLWRLKVDPGACTNSLEAPLKLEDVRSVAADSQQEGYAARNAIDGNPNTMWHTSWDGNAPGFPHELVVQFDKPRKIAGFTALPRQDGVEYGWIKDYALYVSNDGRSWGDPVTRGVFARNGKRKTIGFRAPQIAKYVKLVALTGYSTGLWASLAEFNVVAAETSTASGPTIIRDSSDEFVKLASDDGIRDARWVNDCEGYAYLNQNVLVVKSAVGENHRNIDETVDGIMSCPDGPDLFFVGSISNNPWSGIWRYNLSDRTFRSIVHYSANPSAHAASVEPLHCVTYQDRRRKHGYLDYYIYQPAHFDRNKKYPVLIGCTPFYLLNQNSYQLNFNNANGANWLAAVAAGEAYVVIINRATWDGGIENFENNVMALHEQLIIEPTIDKDRFFLFGISAETQYMSRLIERRPELWKGCLFLSPSGLPDLSKISPGSRLPKMLVSAGADEQRSQQFAKFQKAACARGIAVTLQELPGQRHFLVSPSAIQNRAEAMVEFVFTR